MGGWLYVDSLRTSHIMYYTPLLLHLGGCVLGSVVSARDQVIFSGPVYNIPTRLP